MSIKDILVQISPGAPGKARLDVAVALAERHGAHLTGLCVVDIGMMPGAGMGMIDLEDSRAVALWQEQMRAEAHKTAAVLEADFNERLRREDVAGEWRMVEDRAEPTFALHARYADLVVMGQQDPDDPAAIHWTPVVQAVLLGSGRPLLIVPYVGTFAAPGKRVLIGWNAQREASRAVHDALPLMRDAETVTVLAVDPRGGIYGHGEEPAADISRHLARHGLKVAAAKSPAAGLDPADVLLNQAADMGADLIVVGGYGHSRVWEVVLGGVTQSLLHRMTVPVLMSH